MLPTLKNYLQENTFDIFLSDLSESHPDLDEMLNDGLIQQHSFNKQSLFTLEYSQNILKVLYENQKPIYVDFLDSKVRQQVSKTNRKSLFAKALGLRKNQEHLLDLTAGFGKDSYTVSKYFSKITWVEQNPIVYLLLKDGLKRLSEVNFEEASKFELVFADAKSYLSGDTTSPSESLSSAPAAGAFRAPLGASAPAVSNSQAHVVGAPFTELGQPSSFTSAPAVSIYFDFMFVDKKAKSNKDMFFLKHITQNDPNTDIDEVIKLALHNKPERCVLKAKTYKGSITPKHTYEGSTIKYFIF